MAAANRRLVLACVRDHGPLSRSQIAARVGLTGASISRITAELIERGLLAEVGDVRGRVGRPNTLLGLEAERACVAGVDLRVDGGAVLLADLNGVELTRRAVDLSPEAPPQAWVRSVAEGLRQVLAEVPRELRAVGLAVHGTLSEDLTTVETSPHLGWREVPLVELLRAELGIAAPVWMRNVGECAARALLRAPELGGPDDLLHVQMGVGVGMSVASRRPGFVQRHHGWGDIGHAPLGDPAVRCACGRLGCVDTTLGFGAFVALSGVRVDDTRRGPETQQRVAAEVERRAAGGDPRCRAAMERLTRDLGHVLGVLVAVEAPTVLTVSGYVSGLGDGFVRGLSDGLERWLGGPSPLVPSPLGDQAPGAGAAQLALDAALSG